MTFNDDIADAMIRHQIGLQRFAGSVRRRIWELLDATETDVKALIARLDRAGLDTPARIGRLNATLAKIREARHLAWVDARALLVSEGTALALAEPGFTASILSTAIVGVELETALPPPAQLRAIATSNVFEGRTLKQWGAKLEVDDRDRIETAIRVGMVQGETVPQLARRVVGTNRLLGTDGVTQITRRQATAVARTVVSGISSDARQAFLEENVDLAPRKQFLGTLDAVTTAICRSLDGNVYAVDDPSAPVFPLHFGERSVYVPVIAPDVVGERPRRDFTERQLLREYAADQGLERVPKKRDALPRGHKGSYDDFARKRMRELTGTTSAKTTYTDWLRRQTAANQDDILGATKGALFRRGGLTLDKYVERDGSELSLAQLAKRHADAFRRANLDPADFIK